MSSLAALFSTSPEQSGLQWFELIFFAVAVPPLTLSYLIHRRIPGGSLGWFFIWNFAILRMVAYILIKTADSADQVKTGTIIAGASLSPLFFATAGIWHEVAHWHKHMSPLLYGWRMQIILHLLVGAAIGMAIAGSVTQVYSDGQPSDASQPLEIVGMILFLSVLLGFCLLLVKLWRTAVSRKEVLLLTGVALAIPLLSIRVLYSLIGAAVNNSTWSYYRGPLAAQIIMQVVPECLIVIIYGIVGLLTRGLAAERLAGRQYRADQPSEYAQQHTSKV